MLRYTICSTLLFGALVLTGCGSGLSPVSGVVTIDGKPVEGATVTFVSDDGKQAASGQTDKDGNFTLSEGGVPGARSGSYKVIVTKTKGTSAPGEGASPEDMAKAMKKAAEDDAKAAKGTSKPAGSDAASKMKAMMPSGGSAAPGAEVKSELPAMYASTATTPLSAKVPPDNQPIRLELKSK